MIQGAELLATQHQTSYDGRWDIMLPGILQFLDFMDLWKTIVYVSIEWGKVTKIPIFKVFDFSRVYNRYNVFGRVLCNIPSQWISSIIGKNLSASNAKVLRLNGQRRLNTLEALANINHLESLIELDLMGCDVFDETINKIPSSCEELSLNGQWDAKYTDTGMIAIAKLQVQS